MHALRREPGFDVQNIHFHLNHPIRFVYLCGVVTEIEYLNEWFTLLRLDDGSGMTVEVKMVHVVEKDRGRRGVARSGNGADVRGADAQEEYAGQDDDDAFWIEAAKPLKRLATTTIYRTQVSDLTIHISPYSDNSVILAHQPITIGTTLKAKGTLSTFRDTFQLNLLRAFVVKDVDAEVEVWEGYAEFCKQVLSTPWMLSREEIKRLEAVEKMKVKEERRRVRKENERKVRRQQREMQKRKEWEDKVKRREEKLEVRRKREEIELNGRPLVGL